MNKLSTAGIAITVALLMAACGTGNRLDTDADFDPADGESGGGQYLPYIGRIDTGRINLDDGFLDAGKAAPSEISIPRVVIPNSTTVRLADSTYEDADTEGNLDGIIDFIILILRPLSAHAASNVTAFRDAAQVDPLKFVKVGGAMLEPQGAGFDPSIQLTLPVHPQATPTAGKEFDLYVFVDGSTFGRLAADDIGTDTGHWEYLRAVTVNEDGLSVTFDINYGSGELAGQYAIVTDAITPLHQMGGGGDV